MRHAVARALRRLWSGVYGRRHVLAADVREAAEIAHALAPTLVADGRVGRVRLIDALPAALAPQHASPLGVRRYRWTSTPGRRLGDAGPTFFCRGSCASLAAIAARRTSPSALGGGPARVHTTDEGTPTCAFLGPYPKTPKNRTYPNMERA